MRMGKVVLGYIGFGLGAVLAMAQAKPAHGPFTAKDWAGLHSAHAAAVSANGTILYSVAFGAEKGPTHTEWWTIGSDGNNAKKLEMPDGFHPMGYTLDGQGLYGGWKVNDHQQFAVFALKDGKIATGADGDCGVAARSGVGQSFAGRETVCDDGRSAGTGPAGEFAARAGAGGDKPLRG